jgi:hypothetical protein
MLSLTLAYSSLLGQPNVSLLYQALGETSERAKQVGLTTIHIRHIKMVYI